MAGTFTSVGGQPTLMVAWFDGTSWFPLGDGLNDLAEALAVSGRTVWAGGPFLEAGGVVSAGLAAWDF